MSQTTAKRIAQMPLSRFSAAILSAALLLSLLAPVAWAAPATVQDASQALRKGQPAVALDKVNAFLNANPKDAQGRFLKGLILTELGKNADAIKVFTTLTEDYPELPEPYNNLAVLYAAQADYERAKNSLEMAIRTHPSYATAHENLGDIYAKMASQAYDKAMQLDKSNLSAQTKLALIQDLFSPAPRPQDIAKVKETPKPVAKPVAQAPAPVVATPAVEPTAPAKPQAPVAAAVATPIDAKETIVNTVQAWAAAWSARDPAAYLAFYDAEFMTPAGMDRPTWEAQRSERLTKPDFIKVDLDYIKTNIQDNTATVRFLQRYASNTFKSSDRKTLTLINRNGTWKIQEER